VRLLINPDGKFYDLEPSPSSRLQWIGAAGRRDERRQADSPRRKLRDNLDSLAARVARRHVQSG